MDLERFRYYTSWHRFVNERLYDAPADPWRLVDVDPADVQRYHPSVRLDVGLGRVEAGEWDRRERCERVRETPIYRGLRQRFEEGRDWTDTALYERTVERFDDRDSVRGYDSPAEFLEVRCAYLDDLYASVREDGYRPNEAATHEAAAADNAFEDAYANHLEPLVAVSRRGECYWLEGYHRFAIADLLDLDAIPVYVLVRHADWQAVRDRLHGVPPSEWPPELEAYRDHPDLQDVFA